MSLSIKKNFQWKKIQETGKFFKNYESRCVENGDQSPFIFPILSFQVIHYPCNGQWRVTIFKENQEEMIQSLKILLELEVSLIVPSLYAEYPSYERFDKNKYQSAIKECISRLEKGQIH